MDALGKVAETFGSLALKEIALARGCEYELEKFKDATSIIQAWLSEAEEKQEPEPQLKVWLDKLKKVLYDAEDIEDEFEVEKMRMQSANNRGIRTKVRGFFSLSNPQIFRLRMAHKMKKVNRTLDDTLQSKDKFGLVQRESHMRIITGKREETHSLVSSPDIIGMDAKRKDVIDRLLMRTPTAARDEESKISVIPIVGIGGVGKTTLAKLVYNDPEIESHFDLKYWICVSFDFGVRKLIEEIVKSAPKDPAVPETNYSRWNMESLFSLFRNRVEGKKYLLVLDDVWNKDRMKWNELEGFLRMGANGSKILVTTRSSTVASIMSSIQPINLAGLPDDECMSLFKKTAFKGGQKEVDMYPNLVQIGKELLKKCWGVPLAVMTLGDLLSATRSEHEWKMIKDRKLWEIKQKDSHILPTLKLSYFQLTPPLRRCFAFCAAFDEGYMFTKLELISFWISHGLIDSSPQDSVDVAIQYLEELCSKCLFQYWEVVPGFRRLTMHPLVHDLALSIAENEFYGNARHLLFQDFQSLQHKLSWISVNLNRVRSFGTLGNVGESLGESSILKFLPRFKYLRFLDLSYSEIKVLPKSISFLKHLRYLGLEGNDQIKRLPSFIYKLCCLQTLFFHECRGMQKLPRHLGYFVRLTFLGISTKQKVLPKGGLGCLISLQCLLITECENLEYLCEDFGHLNYLRQLSIHNCKKLILLPDGVKDLAKLDALTIGKCGSLKKLPEGLESLQSLGRLAINNCPELTKRCENETREDWPKIKHIPNVYIDGHVKILHGVKKGDSTSELSEWSS